MFCNYESRCESGSFCNYESRCESGSFYNYESRCESGSFYTYESGCESGSFYAWRDVRRLLVNRYNKSKGPVNTRSDEFLREFLEGRGGGSPLVGPGQPVRGARVARSWWPGSPFVVRLSNQNERAGPFESLRVNG